MLPSGPTWTCKPWATTHPTKSPISLFYCDPIECVDSLLNSPLAADNTEYAPYHLFKTVEKLI